MNLQYKLKYLKYKKKYLDLKKQLAGAKPSLYSLKGINLFDYGTPENDFLDPTNGYIWSLNAAKNYYNLGPNDDIRTKLVKELYLNATFDNLLPLTKTEKNLNPRLLGSFLGRWFVYFFILPNIKNNPNKKKFIESYYKKKFIRKEQEYIKDFEEKKKCAEILYPEQNAGAGLIGVKNYLGKNLPTNASKFEKLNRWFIRDKYGSYNNTDRSKIEKGIEILNDKKFITSLKDKNDFTNYEIIIESLRKLNERMKDNLKTNKHFMPPAYIESNEKYILSISNFIESDIQKIFYPTYKEATEKERKLREEALEKERKTKEEAEEANKCLKKYLNKAKKVAKKKNTNLNKKILIDELKNRIVTLPLLPLKKYKDFELTSDNQINKYVDEINSEIEKNIGDNEDTRNVFKQQIIPFIKNLNSITSENYNLAKDCFGIILSLLWNISNTKEGIKEYYEGLNEYVDIKNLDKFDSNDIFTDKDLKLKKNSPKTFNQALAMSHKAYVGSLSLQQQIEIRPNVGDCNETAFRNFIKVLIYNKKLDSDFDTDILEKIAIRDNNPKGLDDLIKFFEVFKFDSDHSGEVKKNIKFTFMYKEELLSVRKAWIKLTSNIKDIEYLRGGNEELSPTVSNRKKLIKYFFGIEEDKQEEKLMSQYNKNIKKSKHLVVTKDYNICTLNSKKYSYNISSDEHSDFEIKDKSISKSISLDLSKLTLTKFQTNILNLYNPKFFYTSVYFSDMEYPLYDKGLENFYYFPITVDNIIYFFNNLFPVSGYEEGKNKFIDSLINDLNLYYKLFEFIYDINGTRKDNVLINLKKLILAEQKAEEEEKKAKEEAAKEKNKEERERLERKIKIARVFDLSQEKFPFTLSQDRKTLKLHFFGIYDLDLRDSLHNLKEVEYIEVRRGGGDEIKFIYSIEPLFDYNLKKIYTLDKNLISDIDILVKKGWDEEIVKDSKNDWLQGTLYTKV